MGTSSPAGIISAELAGLGPFAGAASRPPAGSDIPRPGRRWRTRVLVPAALLAATLGLLAYAARALLTPIIDVRVVPVVMKPVGGAFAAGSPAPRGLAGALLVQAPGWIEPDPFAITIPALIGGVVTQVNILDGQSVDAGDIVARLDPQEHRAAEQAALAVLSEREAMVEVARASVPTGRAAALIERALVAELADDITRKRPLAESGAFSAGELRRMELRLAGLEAAFERAQSAVGEAEASVVAAIAATGSAQAALATARLRLGRTEVRSPAAGVVLARLVEPGSRVTSEGAGMEPGQGSNAVARLYDPRRLQVRCDIPLGDAGKVGLGTRAEISTEALPDQTLHGTVTRLVHEANIQRNTVQVKVAIEDPSEALRPEMLCRVRFVTSADARVNSPAEDSVGATDGAAPAAMLMPVLPLRLILNRAGEAGDVWTIDNAGDARGDTAVLRRVAFAPYGPDDAAIRSGLNAGDRAIADPDPSLRPGIRVRVIGEAGHGEPGRGQAPDTDTEGTP